MDDEQLRNFFIELETVADAIYKERSEEEKTLAKIMRELSKVMFVLEQYRDEKKEFEDFKKEYDNLIHNLRCLICDCHNPDNPLKPEETYYSGGFRIFGR